VQLRFDPAYLEFVAAKPGKFLGGMGRDFTYRANPDGSIFVGDRSRIRHRLWAPSCWSSASER